MTTSSPTVQCNGEFQNHVADRSLQSHLVWILIGNGSSVIKLNSEDIEASRQQRVQTVVVTADTRLVSGHQGGAASVLGGLWGHGGRYNEIFETMFNQIELWYHLYLAKLLCLQFSSSSEELYWKGISNTLLFSDQPILSMVSGCADQLWNNSLSEKTHTLYTSSTKK